MTDDIQLGEVYCDRISGFRGVVTTIAEHITGCTRYGLHPTGEVPSRSRGEEEFFFADQLQRDDQIATKFPEAEPTTSSEVELGNVVKDDITDIEGVVTTIGFKLFNCPRVAVEPMNSEDADREWFDVPRVDVVGDGVRDEYADLMSSAVTSETGAPSTDFQSKMDSA